MIEVYAGEKQVYSGESLRDALESATAYMLSNQHEDTEDGANTNQVLVAGIARLEEKLDSLEAQVQALSKVCNRTHRIVRCAHQASG